MTPERRRAANHPKLNAKSNGKASGTRRSTEVKRENPNGGVKYFDKITSVNKLQRRRDNRPIKKFVF